MGIVLLMVAVVVGTLAADFLGPKVSSKISDSPNVQRGVRVAMTVGISALTFGLLAGAR